MDLFSYSDYKLFVRDWVKSKPNRGRGQFRRMAIHLKVGTVLISQVFSGKRNLSQEQSFELCQLLGLSNLERRYFLFLVQKERAGTESLKNYLEDELTNIRAKAKQLKHRIVPGKTLTLEDAATFYSDWIYSGVRLATSVPEFSDLEILSERFRISQKKLRKIAHFLISRGLCIEEKGKLRIGPRSTHIGADSPLISKHHMNWRIQAMSKLADANSDELFYTSPVSLSLKDISAIRKTLVELIESFSERVKNSGSDTLACLNIDWFRW
jgi:uncharacterized protein (TIGR02147 family)